MKKVLIIGAGFSGATVARELAERGIACTVVDKRQHIAGNAYDYRKNGILVHQYGAHIFHTPNKKVWDFVNRFAEFNDYKHHVRTCHNNQNFSMPISLDTINQFVGGIMSPKNAREWVKHHASEITGVPQNLEEKAISLIGRPLYEAFIKAYTWKQWETDPKDLPASIITRLPVRFNFDTRYFNDRFEGMPIGGYTNLISEMLNHKNITVHCGVDGLMFDFRKYDAVYHCGPVDHFFGYKFGRLNWRSVDFKFWVHPEIEDRYGTSVTNFADFTMPETRVIEFKHFYPEEWNIQEGTILAYEKSKKPENHDEFYYPVNTETDRQTMSKYTELAQEHFKEKKILLGGRLGRYKYFDMHQAIAIAFNDANEIEGVL
uniref:UDP-galactopyranose mutase C-terminal domain-containing protein n=1 Tax=Ochrobactrum phage ORM_20 TaxID=2985243 RepID=A0A9N6WZY0_9VIRU|nr:hypothetical protein ORM20_00146 [Ochrobactrum phage ORM_20]